MGGKDGTFRPRTVHRVPEEKRWQDHLPYVTGLPCKINKDHDEAEEVLLDATPPAPSMEPTTSPLPRTMARDPTVRRYYVKTSSVYPKEGGMGFTAGCAGCTYIVLGTTRAGHSDSCRLRVTEKESQSSAAGAERVKKARAMVEDYLCMKR